MLKKTLTGGWDLDRNPGRQRELRSRVHDVARYVRALLGPSWDREALSEELEFVLWNGFRNYIGFRFADTVKAQGNGNGQSAEEVALSRIRRTVEIIEFELPLIWLHPVSGSVDRREVLDVILGRLSTDRGNFVRQAFDYPSESSLEVPAEVTESWMHLFVEWVDVVIDATESAFASVSQAEALQTAIAAAYRQSCRDQRRKSLDETGVMEFRRWIDGIVEAVADLEETRGLGA